MKKLVGLALLTALGCSPANLKETKAVACKQWNSVGSGGTADNSTDHGCSA